MSMSCGTNPQTVLRSDHSSDRVYERRSSLRFERRSFPRLTTQIVTDAIQDRVSNISAKEIQDATQSSIRAAENVKAGLNAMSLTNFLNACRAIPELRALALEMMGCEAETDPEFVKGLSMLIQAHSRKAHTAGASA